MVTLQTVEIPGYREALRRESRIRDTAFLDGLESVCGVVVRPLCLESLIWLEHAKNGFFVACVFDDERERLAHAIQVLYFCRPEFSPPNSPKVGFWESFKAGWREQIFIRRMARWKYHRLIVKEVESWTKDAFMDAPSGGNSEVAPKSYASYPAYIVDMFAEAGLPFTYREIMTMPLRRLWQHWRIASRRINGIRLNNPSDMIAVDFVAKEKP